MSALEIARCKNVKGGPDNEDPMPPPRLTAQQKVKAKKTTKKKRKRDDVEAERAVAVAAAVEHAERGGSRGGIRLGDQLSPAQRAPSRGLRLVLVVHPGLSCLEDSMSL